MDSSDVAVVFGPFHGGELALVGLFRKLVNARSLTSGSARRLTIRRATAGVRQRLIGSKMRSRVAVVFT